LAQARDLQTDRTRWLEGEMAKLQSQVSDVREQIAALRAPKPAPDYFPLDMGARS
jgi:hypothetical protein